MDGNKVVCTSVNVMSSDEFSRTDLRREKFLFTNTRFLHQDGDPTKPLEKAEVDDIQPVDRLGNVFPIYGSSVTARVPQYLVGCPHAISSKTLTSSDNSNHTEDDYHVKLIDFGETRMQWFSEDPDFGKPRMTEEVQWFSKDFDFGYQAPEVLLDSQLGPSADVWSLACLVCMIAFCLRHRRLITGKDLRGFEWSKALLSLANKR